MKKYLIFILLFCSAKAFAQASCVISPDSVYKITLIHTIRKVEVQEGYIYLKNRTKIKIDGFSSWCDCPIGSPCEFTEFTNNSTDLPEYCSLSLSSGCKCKNDNKIFSCYKPS